MEVFVRSLCFFLESTQGTWDNACKSRERMEEEKNNQAVDPDLPEAKLDSDDSVFEYERNLIELMQGLQEDSSSMHLGQLEQHNGTRHSERQKMRSSKWNDNAGFLAKPPRSTKRKLARGNTAVDMAKGPQAKFDDSTSTIKHKFDFFGQSS